MANMTILDGLGAEKEIKGTGAGTNLDPFIGQHLETNSAAILTALQLIDNMIAGNEAQVDVVTLPALPAGTNNIGDVDVLSLPAIPTGSNTIGNVGVLSLPALVAGTANIGDVDVLTLPALPAGNNNIGDVDVASLPALPAGTNNIGDVDVLTLPALPTGTNTIGNVGVARTATTTRVGTVSTTTNTIVTAPTSGKRWRILAWSFWNETGTATKATLKTATVTIDAYYMLSQGFGKNGELALNEDLVLGINETISLDLSVATTVGYSLRVQEV